MTEHSRVSNDRCTAVIKMAPKSALGPGTPPERCSSEAGHKGSHFYFYGTVRYKMDERHIEHKTLEDICVKCRTAWPCKEAQAVLDAFKIK